MELLAFMLLLFSLSTAEDVQYIKPSTSGDCPGQLCLTLDQYIQNSSKFFTTGSVFEFLSGNHSLGTSLNITAVSNISLRATEGSRAIVTCNDEVTVNNVTSLNIKGITFILNLTLQEGKLLSAFIFTNSQEVIISNSIFKKESINSPGRAILSTDSSITIVDCLFENNRASDGGAIFAGQKTVMTLTGNNFTRNEAGKGGAIYAEKSEISLSGSLMDYNSGYAGGAIHCHKCTITMADSNDFHNNFVEGSWSTVRGGAIAIEGGKITARGYATFYNNTALKGGAISLVDTRAEFREGYMTFKENVAKYVGGGMYIATSPSFTTVNQSLTFTGNIAEGMGDTEDCGVMCLYNSKSTITNNISATLVNNTGTSGGALFIEKTNGFTFNNIKATENIGGALGILDAKAKIVGTNLFSHNTNLKKGAITIVKSTVTFDGSNTFEYNHAEGAITTNVSEQLLFIGRTVICNNIGSSGGGGINATDSSVIFHGETLFCNNSGHNGGAIFIARGTLELAGHTNFRNNVATEQGGGVYASSTGITMDNTVIFSDNSAQRGGAMYLKLGATLTLEWYMNLSTIRNIAIEYGGAIYHEDSITILQCKNVTNILRTENNLALTIQESFLQIKDRLAVNDACPHINSYNDFAGQDGHFLYGGLLDRSRFNVPDATNLLPFKYFTSVCNISVSPLQYDTNAIASDPFELSSCDIDEIDFQAGIRVYRGQTFRLRITALGQGMSTVPTTVTALISPTARLKLNQNSQRIPRHCSEVIYNLYSTNDYEKLTIFPEGPCQTLGQASTVFNVTFLPCPDAFNQSNEECLCEDRLKEHSASCVIEDGISIWRYAGKTFWMNASYHENGSYGGLILYRACPAEYCTTDTVNISLNNPDSQCAFSHSGVLCGECASNYSLLLGGPRCQVCSNVYLLLLLPFAVAGIALIAFLSYLRLTVATGTINSLILYANFVQVNRIVFFPSTRANILTVFIAWANLDLGFETCFFDGMDVYTQTWLQFVFSAYVWILIGLIIVSSRYSITVSKLIGSNPVAVLATLLLMSYNKILKVIIDVFSSVNLDYPDDKQVTVWLKDGNLPYLRSRHLFLSVFILLVLVFVFLPYTVFLLLGYLLYRLPHRKYYHWLLIRIKPILDSYYAPYKTKTRYWTGFLLLVRCALYIVFSFNSLGGTKYSLLAIIIAFTAVGSLTWLMKGVYRHFYMDVIEVSVYVNLVILSAAAATLSEAKKEIATYTLVGIVFTTAVGIVLYQLHLNHCAKSALWLKIKSKIPHYQRGVSSPIDFDALIQNTPEPDIPVSKTVINLREPLLEN